MDQMDPEMFIEEIQCCESEEDLINLVNNLPGVPQDQTTIINILKIFKNYLEQQQLPIEKCYFNQLIKDLAVENQKLRQLLLKSETHQEELRQQDLKINRQESMIKQSNYKMDQQEQKIKLFQGDLNEIYKLSIDELTNLEDNLNQTLKVVNDQKKFLIERSTENATNSKLCVICLSKSYCILLKPCGHVCVCEDCINKIKKCPIDRIAITKSKKVFLS